jgi:hypothetical protein
MIPVTTTLRGGVLGCLLAMLAGCLPLTRAPADVQRHSALPPGSLRLYAVGDIADCRRDAPQDASAARTAALVPAGALVLGLGDMAYPYADAATLAHCYEPAWGAHRAGTLAVAGNHDYVDGSARDFREYFGLDEVAASERFVAYARALGPDWSLVVLDSNATGAAMQEQRQWLEHTLERLRPRGAAHGSLAVRCLAVAWHTPLFSSGWHRGSGDHMRGFWELLDAYGADLVLSGHEHFYEAFDPFDAEGRLRRDGEGIRQFTVGTGGARLYGFWRPPYASRARVLEFGVLELTLEPRRYTWRFVDLDGRVRDAGDATCRGAASDEPGVPSSAELG